MMIQQQRLGKLTAEAAWDAHVSMGFCPEQLAPLRDKLPALAAILFEPFTIGKAMHPDAWKLGERVKACLGEWRMQYRTAGPPGLIYLLRTFQGVIGYLKTWNVPVNWSEIFDETMTTLESTPVQPRLKSSQGQTVPTEAESLKIRVLENGSPKVELTFKACAVDNLEDLIPAEHRSKLDQRGIQLEALIRECRQNQYRPCTLFSLNDGPKEIKVWLE